MLSDSKTTTLTLAFHGQRVQLDLPTNLAAKVERLFPAALLSAAQAENHITVCEQAGGYSLQSRNGHSIEAVGSSEILIHLIEEVTKLLITELGSGVALQGAAIGCGDLAILMPGLSGSGKSSLAAWLLSEGYDYLSDEIAVLTPTGAIIGLPRPLVIEPGAAGIVQGLVGFNDSKSVRAGMHLLKVPLETKIETGARKVGLIVFPNYQQGSETRIESLSPGETVLRLDACNLNARNLQDGGYASVSELSRTVPAIQFRFGDFSQLKGTLNAVINFAVTNRVTVAEMRRFLAAFVSSSEPVSVPKYAVPAATPRKRAKTKLTVGMTTYDDYDGVYFSLQALRLYHPEVLGDVEFVVIDNHPGGPCSEPLKQLEKHISNYRYVPYSDRLGTAVRDRVFAEAAGKFVLCIDCHVFVMSGALKQLVDYCEAHEQTSDLLQGPLVNDDLTTVWTHFHPEWRNGMFGYWDLDERGSKPDAEPFEIPMQGLGLFACRKTAWPGFNPNFRGFGGEEGYIHEKFRRRGDRTLCLPFLRWVHRFNRPLGPRYLPTWDDRIRNYLIGWQELGLATESIREHFDSFLGASAAERIFHSLELAGVYASAQRAPRRRHRRGREPAHKPMPLIQQMRVPIEPDLSRLSPAVILDPGRRGRGRNRSNQKKDM